MSRDLRVKLRYMIEVERTVSNNNLVAAVWEVEEIARQESAGFLPKPYSAVVEDVETGRVLLVQSGGETVIAANTPRT